MNPEGAMNYMNIFKSPISEKEQNIKEIISDIKKTKTDWAMVQSLKISDEVKEQIKAEFEKKIEEYRNEIYEVVETITLSTI
jgi:hypothetical protein